MWHPLGGTLPNWPQPHPLSLPLRQRAEEGVFMHFIMLQTYIQGKTVVNIAEITMLSEFA